MTKLIAVFGVLFSFLASPAGAAPEDNFITRDELFEMALSGDVDQLQRLFAETHRDVSAGRRQPSHMRFLNTVLIVSHPRILEVSQDWLNAYPDSIYAKTLVSFQLHDAAWRMRGENTGRGTHPDAHYYFKTYRQQAFDFAYDAFKAAPGYIPASDAVLTINRTLHVFWGYEIESIVDDTMEQSPNLGTLWRAANMHLPQWGGEGLSGVRRHCRKYVPLIQKREGLTPETCIALLTFEQSFPERDRERAAHALANAHVEDFEWTLIKVIMHLRLEDRHEEVQDALSQDSATGANAIDLARRYASWRSTPEATKLMDTVIRRTLATAKEELYYDPYSPTHLETIQTFQNVFAENPLPANHREVGLDLAARKVGGAPFSSYNWADLATRVRYAHGFDESRSYQSNAMAYGLHKEDVTFNYLYQIHVNWRNKLLALEQGRLSSDDFKDTEETMMCEVVRLTRLTEELCSYDSSFYAESCDPFKSAQYRLDHEIEEVADLIAHAESGAFQCSAERSADLDGLIYNPVVADIEKFIINPRAEQLE